MKIFVVCLLFICLTFKFTCAKSLFDDDDLPLNDGYKPTDADDDNDALVWSASEVADDTDVITDDQYAQLEDCSHRNCSFCSHVWELDGCVVARLSGDSIHLWFTFNGETILSTTITGRNNYTFHISPRKFDGFRSMVENFEIKVSELDVYKKRFCVTAIVSVKIGGHTIRYSSGPKCAQL